MRVANEFIKMGKNTIFPVFCLGCKKEGFLVCIACYSKISCKGVFFCPVCHHVNESGSNCEKCTVGSYLEKHIAVTKYDESDLIGDIIHNLKYNFVQDLKLVIGRMIADFTNKNMRVFNQVDIVVPVPLHKRRYAERGFNQAEIIAKIIGSIFDVPVHNVLERRKYTKHQAHLPRRERLINVENAFNIIDDVCGRGIIVVDDVFTTGATLQECARILKTGGAKSVCGFSVARG